jgi:hypothetical protein
MHSVKSLANFNFTWTMFKHRVKDHKARTRDSSDMLLRVELLNSHYIWNSLTKALDPILIRQQPPVLP